MEPFDILVSRITAANRLTVCSTCPFAKMPGPICTKCGCHLAIKSRFKMADCPLGKWPNKDDTDNDSE